MPLSAKKKAKMEMTERRAKVNARSLDGKGYFMDANVEADVRHYMETGDNDILQSLPNYPAMRVARLAKRR